MDNSEINKFIVLKIKSYTFTEDIEQIYNCFLSSSILGKIETKGYPYSLTGSKIKKMMQKLVILLNGISLSIFKLLSNIQIKPREDITRH